MTSARRRARSAATVGTSTTVAGLPAKYLDPNDPEWHDDRRDLAFVREFYDSVPAEVEDAVCRLGRWKRLLAAAEQYAVEQGWVDTAPKREHPIVDRKRMAAAGVPLLQWRQERKRLVALSMRQR